MNQPTFADLEYECKKRKTRRELFLERMGGTLKKCVNGQAVYPLSEQHGLEAQERR